MPGRIAHAALGALKAQRLPADRLLPDGLTGDPDKPGEVVGGQHLRAGEDLGRAGSATHAGFGDGLVEVVAVRGGAFDVYRRRGPIGLDEDRELHGPLGGLGLADGAADPVEHGLERARAGHQIVEGGTSQGDLFRRLRQALGTIVVQETAARVVPQHHHAAGASTGGLLLQCAGHGWAPSMRSKMSFLRQSVNFVKFANFREASVRRS